ncbi:hypothetical protein D9758_016625 [Tetrapyrgos nigripes]|uniref:Uncharacterized protein n=1 Tax=Tetrapyrgos nigripes TaxID=182062 RepID=A0A8H5FIL9_9AGAR|nr:hypothetical protein D9758_016625 [Tetrapyrgos nigripes]
MKIYNFQAIISPPPIVLSSPSPLLFYLKFFTAHHHLQTNRPISMAMANPNSIRREPAPDPETEFEPESISRQLPSDLEGPRKSPRRMQRPRRYLIDYKLPALVAALRDNWTTTLRTGMIVSSIIFLASFLILIIFQSLFLFQDSQINDNRLSKSTARALLSLTYLAIIFELDATICAFILIDQVNEVYLYSAAQSASDSPNSGHDGGGTDHGWVVAKTSTILRRYGVRRSWELGIWHWFLSLTLAVWLGPGGNWTV